MTRKLNSKAVGGAVDEAVIRTMYGAINRAVYGTVWDAVNGAVDEAVIRPMYRAMDWAVIGAVDGAVHEAVHEAVRVSPLHSNLDRFLAEIQQTRGVET